ncbi:MAG: zinc ribbon domain-containing protein, partial [Marmoricola sp.]|nr:zinc ribbon domain-containing protein [Marmoricola sp.]
LGLLVPVVAGALGFLAFAFVAAALLVPAVYTIYMYDVNQWEDEPLGVMLGTLGVAGVLGVGFTWLWHGVLERGTGTVGVGAGVRGIDWTGLLVLCLLVPVVSEVLKQVGPVVLARRPAFDDLIDALSFGVAAGSAYAAAETIVVNRALFSDFGHLTDVNSTFWVSLVLSDAIVKPIVYGAATGIAVAAFSGVGRGYLGFKAPYARGLAEAVGANVVFQLAMYVAGLIGGSTGAIVGLVLGAAIAVVLLLRLRYLLHVAVLEAALESSSTGEELRDTAHGTAWCPSCHLPLVDGANFCVACGTAVRAGHKVSRRRNALADEAATAGAPAHEPPHDHKRTALVVGSSLAVVLAAGLVAQVAAGASADVKAPPNPTFPITANQGGPTTGPAPSPAPAPGPSVSPSVSPSASPSAAGVLGGSGLPQAAGAPREMLVSTSDGQAGGVNVRLASGWSVLEQNSSRIVAAKANHVWIVEIAQPPADAGAMMQANLQGLAGSGVQSLEYSDPVQMPLPNANFVAAVRLNLRGLVATQQGGSVPVEGFSFYLLRRDGVGITASGLFPQGDLQRDPNLLKEYGAMFNALLL